MSKRSIGFSLSTIILVAALTAVPSAGQSPSPYPPHGMMGQGMMGQGMMGQGMMGQGMMQSTARNHQAMMVGIPAPYTSLRNPLPATNETLERGSKIYAQNCASCHGATGLGNGEAGKGLTPPPANLAWFSRMPMSKWDPFMYWTIAEGGQQFGTAMPAFKDALADNDIWAAISFVQWRLGNPN